MFPFFFPSPGTGRRWNVSGVRILTRWCVQLSKRAFPTRVMSISVTVHQVVQIHAVDVHEDEFSDGIDTLWGVDDMGSGTDEDDSDGDMEEEILCLLHLLRIPSNVKFTTSSHNGSNGPGSAHTCKIRIVT